jgi:hypothetical protein
MALMPDPFCHRKSIPPRKKRHWIDDCFRAANGFQNPSPTSLR